MRQYDPEIDEALQRVQAHCGARARLWLIVGAILAPIALWHPFWPLVWPVLAGGAFGLAAFNRSRRLIAKRLSGPYLIEGHYQDDPRPYVSAWAAFRLRL